MPCVPLPAVPATLALIVHDALLEMRGNAVIAAVTHSERGNPLGV